MAHARNCFDDLPSDVLAVIAHKLPLNEVATLSAASSTLRQRTLHCTAPSGQTYGAIFQYLRQLQTERAQHVSTLNSLHPVNLAIQFYRIDAEPDMVQSPISLSQFGEYIEQLDNLAQTSGVLQAALQSINLDGVISATASVVGLFRRRAQAMDAAPARIAVIDTEIGAIHAANSPTL